MEIHTDTKVKKEQKSYQRCGLIGNSHVQLTATHTIKADDHIKKFSGGLTLSYLSPPLNSRSLLWDTHYPSLCFLYFLILSSLFPNQGRSCRRTQGHYYLLNQTLQPPPLPQPSSAFPSLGLSSLHPSSLSFITGPGRKDNNRSTRRSYGLLPHGDHRRGMEVYCSEGVR